MTKLIERALRRGMSAMTQDRKPVRTYREKTFSMGQPRVDLTKALAVAASLEDEEIRRKLAARK